MADPMDIAAPLVAQVPSGTGRYLRKRTAITFAMVGVLIGAGLGAGGFLSPRVTAAEGSPKALAPEMPEVLPPPPADGVMGFVVSRFVPPIVPGMEACPHGTVPPMREAYLKTLPAAEAARLRLKENEHEYVERWHAYAFDNTGANVCSQPDRFDHPAYTPVESKYSYGMNLDGKGNGQTDDDGCAHDNFESPSGEQGIDNQVYRALGCTPTVRGLDGTGGDLLNGLNQFHASGEWTQVVLLRGVDSLQNDQDVEVIYGNTPDRPVVDSKGKFLPGMSYTISTKAPRHRNVLHGRIVNGVLITDPAEIVLTQTWGQGGTRDIRGNRTVYDFKRGRLRLEFHRDGTVTGMVGGYQPLTNVIASTMLGGAGSPLNAGMDCAAALATLRKYADGMRDPKTHKCTAISDAMKLTGVSAFVNDAPGASGTGAKTTAKR